MFKRILSVIICACLVLTSCSKNKEVLSDNDNLPAQGGRIPTEDKFDLTPIKSDKNGMDISSGFQLTSKDNINEKYVKDNLKIIPEEEFKIDKVSSTVYNIIPRSQLENDKIYQVALADEEYDYSWAFQTKKKFEVESTLPADDSNDVPVNSGIEMYFSLSKPKKMDDFFEISPKVEGKFMINGSTVIFVPEQLDKNTIYTVTVKKGFGLEDGSDELNEDYVFSFKTQTDREQLYFDRPIINIHESNPKIIDAYVNGEKEYNISIFRYKDTDKFAEDVYKYAETGKFPKEINKDILTLNGTIKQKPFMMSTDYYYRNAMFELPDDIPKGYYLLEFRADDSSEPQYLFLQINDILIYNAIFTEQFLVFACDGNTGKGIIGASVLLNNEEIGRTGEDGTLVYDMDDSELKTIMLRVKSDGYNDFIYGESSYIERYYYRSMYDRTRYMTYIDTDRPVYLPNDTVNVWGFARYRDNKSLNRVKIELMEQGTELILETKYADLTSIGTYQTQFDLENVTSEGLIIKVYDNDILISVEYISVKKYTKPLYTLKGELSREFGTSGENINYKINANFFDGYPVSNLNLNFKVSNYGYDGNVVYSGMDQVFTLDENGEYTVMLDTQVRSTGWRPVSLNIDCYNNDAEETSVASRENLLIFPKEKMLELEQDINNPEKVDVLFHEMNIENYNPDNYYDWYAGYENLRGTPQNDKVHVTVTERYYEKVKKGEQYDFINKVNEILYDYNLVEDVVFNEYINTVSGIVQVIIPDFNPEKGYTVQAYYEDNNGGILEESYFSGRSRPYYRDYYELNAEGYKDNYRLNEDLKLQLTYGDKNVENIEKDNMFIMFMRNGLLDYAVTENTGFQTSFKEDYIPNVMLNCVYVKNGYIYQVGADLLMYDRSERELKLDISTDKEEYRPGEEVKLKINATDENNIPCVADINISVVDEAYFALFNKNTDTLSELYSYSWDSGLRRSYLSNIDLSAESSMAERGGGGGDDGVFRDEFKDTNIFETVRTDKNGNAEMKFKLADNLTSWRITCQGISDKLYAGSEIKNITVSLPFYVDMIMGSEYLKDDKINVFLRVFGNEADNSEQVEYKVDIINKDTGKKLNYSEKGKAGDYTNISLGNLDEGEYEIYASAKSKGAQDGIKEEFRVVDSSIYFNNTDYYKLSENMVLDEVYSNPVITLFNESSSDFYNSLETISSANGKRIDQTVCSMIAAKYINEYFDGDLYFDEAELLNQINKYESEDGGLRLFPYSEPDVEVTAKAAHVLDNNYLEAKQKSYFKNILDTDVYSDQIPAALWGLSKYKEPVLLKIYELLENEDLKIRDRIYLSLALAELGDNKTARKYYSEITPNLKNSGEYLYLWTEEDAEDNYDLTALLAILGGKVRDYDTSDKLFKYIYNKPSKYTLSSIEQLIYIMDRNITELDEIKDLFGEVTVTVDGGSKTYKLKLFDRESFAVRKDKIKDVKFSGINGSIACKVEALGNKDDLEKNRTEDFSISIGYADSTTQEEQISYNYSDVVRVTIVPKINPKIEYGCYEITYVVPSGFRYIEGYRDSTWAYANGQKLIFDYYYNRKNPNERSIVFYMQAAQKGEYTVDYAVIKEYFESKLNYVEKTKLTVN